MDDLLQAQQTFIQTIHDTIHYCEFGIEEKEMVSTIIETIPEFLATVKFNNIPIQEATIANEYPEIFVPLYANVGFDHGIGGTHGRGGLLFMGANDEDNNVFQTISLFRNGSKCIQFFDAVKHHTPPLFSTNDIRKYYLVHCAVEQGNLDLVKYFINLDPTSIYHTNDKDEIPLFHVPSGTNDHTDDVKKVMRFLLQARVLDSSRIVDGGDRDDTIGGLFAKSNCGMTALQYLISNHEGREDDLWDKIEEALSPYISNHPILHKVIEHCPDQIAEVIKRFPESILIRDGENRLPIHVALDKGIPWSENLACMIMLGQQQLKEVDPVTRWPPFALAGKNCDLRTIYTLLRKNPEHVQILDDGQYRYIPVINEYEYMNRSKRLLPQMTDHNVKKQKRSVKEEEEV